MKYHASLGFSGEKHNPLTAGATRPSRAKIIMSHILTFYAYTFCTNSVTLLSFSSFVSTKSHRSKKIVLRIFFQALPGITELHYFM